MSTHVNDTYVRCVALYTLLVIDILRDVYPRF